MTLREKYIKAVKREDNSYVPYYFELTPPQIDKFREIYGHDNYEDTFKFPVRVLRVKYSGEDPKIKYAKYLNKWISNPNIQVGAFGDVKIKSETTHFSHYEAVMGDFEEVKEFQEYPYPDGETDYDWETFKNQVEELHRKEVAAEGELDITIFEIAWYMRGMEQTLMDMYLNEDLLNYHLDRITSIRCKQAKIIASSGADIIKLGDDVATQLDLMMDPVIWRKYFKYRMKQIIDAAKSVNPEIIIKYHTDGNPGKLIDEFIEIGIELLNPIQPECIEPEYVKQKYGDRLSFDGTLGTQTVMPFGNSKDVEEECKKLIKTCAYNGGLVLAPSHVIEPEVPWDNIVTFVKVLEDYNLGKVLL